MTTPPRQPVFNVPGSVLVLLALLVVVHLVRLLSTQADEHLIASLAFVPIRLTALLHPAAAARHLTVLTSGGPSDDPAGQLGRFFLAQNRWGVPVTVLTYALLHGSWTHLGLNGIWLLAFGTPVARRFGALRFLLFFALAAAAGALTHWGLFPFGVEPLIGASAGVSGCMGAAVRFAFRGPSSPDRGRPDEGLVATLRDRRALVFIVVWFATNALFGAGSSAFGFADQPVAWQAHIGGFLVGLLLFRVFARPWTTEDARVPPTEPPLAP